jgi:hypothetical protein
MVEYPVDSVDSSNAWEENLPMRQDLKVVLGYADSLQ